MGIIKPSDSGYLLPGWNHLPAEGIPSWSLVKLWICSCLFALPKHWSHLGHSSVLQHSRNLFSARFYSGHCKICWERGGICSVARRRGTPWKALAVPLEPLSGFQVGTDPGNLPQLLPRGCHGRMVRWVLRWNLDRMDPSWSRAG